MRSANKLFSTGFIESVLNQKNCTSQYLNTNDFDDTEWNQQKISKYIESASKLDKSNRSLEDVMPF